jgi:hypothetical protein
MYVDDYGVKDNYKARIHDNRLRSSRNFQVTSSPMPYRRSRRASFTALDLTKSPLPVRKKPIRRKGLLILKLLQAALMPGKRPATALRSSLGGKMD